LLVSPDHLAHARTLFVDWARLAFDAVVLQILRQRFVFVLWIVTQLMLPSITFVTCYCPAVVIEVATDAAYLAVVLLRAFLDWRAIA
jgi:hypothetical protein